MLDGTMQNRRAILAAADVVGQIAKYSFVGIAYLGISLAVAIRLGDKTVKIIKAHLPNEAREEECL